MRQRASRLIYYLGASYWFVPAVMAFLAIVLGGVMVWLDAGPAAGLLDGLGWYQKAKPDGAHEVLSTIAGSMITVAGVVFSITIVAIAFAAGQYGPRILTNFMSDRGNQFTLGTFIATFVYCLVVLRTIRAGDTGEFVPQLAVMVGLLLALCSIAVLIFFIHHVPSSIHINNVAARIGRQLLSSLDDRFPGHIGGPPADDGPPDTNAESQRALRDGREMAEICSASNGYVEAVDDEALMETACSDDLVVRLHHGPGDYLLRGQPLMSAWSRGPVDDETKAALQRSFSIGTSRTPTQDLFFLVDELVEISGRALSSGINDPYTAMTCLDWLAAAAAELCRRHIPPAGRVDRRGVLRVLAPTLTFDEFIDRGFGRMRQYLARDMNASVHALDRLAAVSASCRSAGHRVILKAEAGKLLSMAENELSGPALAGVRERYQAAQAAWSDWSSSRPI